jgi:hypothetical protein
MPKFHTYACIQIVFIDRWALGIFNPVILVTLFMAFPLVSLTSPVSAKGVFRLFLLPFCYIGSVVLFYLAIW